MSTTEPPSYTPTPPTDPATKTTPTIHIELTPHPLSPSHATAFVRSPSAGATVLFIGTTRNTFDGRAVASLSYTAYTPLALTTLYTIGAAVLAKHACTKLAIVHRLGECGVGEESVVVAVSAPHRGAAWRAGEEALEEVKRKAEIWKLERFEGGEGVWRANREGEPGGRTGRANRDGGVGVRIEGED